MRLIDADKMIADLLTVDPQYETMIDWCIRVTEAQPTIEPERQTGRWQITEAYPHNVYCSECHKRFAQTHWAVWEDGSLPRNYCPSCGARMMEVEHERC